MNDNRDPLDVAADTTEEWNRQCIQAARGDIPQGKPGECDPETAEWHGVFEKRPARGMLLGEDGFLYSQPPRHTEIVGEA